MQARRRVAHWSQSPIFRKTCDFPVAENILIRRQIQCKCPAEPSCAWTVLIDTWVVSWCSVVCANNQLYLLFLWTAYIAGNCCVLLSSFVLNHILIQLVIKANEMCYYVIFDSDLIYPYYLAYYVFVCRLKVRLLRWLTFLLEIQDIFIWKIC